MTRVLIKNSLRQFKDTMLDARKASDEPYLSYFDVCLTVEDMKALRSDWLTDNNISFWEEYLEHEVLSQYEGVKIILMRPSMVMLIKEIEDVRTIKDALPDIWSASHLFLPINDCDNPAIPEGGSHWSLLVVGVRDSIAFHYDSLIPSNETQARLVSMKIEQLLRKPIRYTQLRDTPQQTNGMDCGVHVCMTMRHLLVERLLRKSSNQNVDMSMRRERQDATEYRKYMARLIEKLRAHASRGPSPQPGGRISPPRIS